MIVWAQAFLKLGLVLFVLGAAPAIVCALLFPDTDPLIPGLLSLSVAPLGAFCLLAGALMWIVGRLRR